ncbi:MAG: hypothetical protein LBC41_00355 [Clostridiales bacterium]|jgi:hypothetical protein|nr:hypothetical protein [Clostridiales bacterium]MDR2749084.1 hypothetical protein [Clostridiales bacterium]
MLSKTRKPISPLTTFLRTNLKFLFLVPIAIMIIFSVFFVMIFEDMEKAIFEEKFLERKTAVDAMAVQLDFSIGPGSEWNEFSYLGSLIAPIHIMNSLKMSFCAIYNQDFKLLSEVGAGDLISQSDPFNPVADKTFREYANSYESYDKLEMIYAPEEKLPVNLRLYFRWFPSDASIGHRYLVVMAMSEESILNSVSTWVPVMSITLIIITTILNFAMVEIICTRKQEESDTRDDEDDPEEKKENDGETPES